MPKQHSRRVAARQAELSKKKKRAGSRPAITFEPPRGQEPTAPPQDLHAPQTPEPRPDAAAVPPAVVTPPPALPAPQRAPAAAAFGRRPGAAPTGTPSRRALAPSPYLASDLTRIGIIGGGLFVVLIVLAFVLR